MKSPSIEIFCFLLLIHKVLFSGNLGIQHLRLQDADLQQARVPGLGRGPRVVHRSDVAGSNPAHGRRADRKSKVEPIYWGNYNFKWSLNKSLEDYLSIKEEN